MYGEFSLGAYKQGNWHTKPKSREPILSLGCMS
jgi:hypothetical protein